MEQQVVHDGQHYRVVRVPAERRGLTVVGFDYWQPAPSRERVSMAAEFFGRHGIDFFGIQPARNDWFQDDEILAAIAAILRATPGARRVGYGASMGGFAAINFAEDLGLASVVAICPQFSIQPARAPFERRWRQFVPEIDFRHDKIDRIAPIRSGYAMFDPAHIDREHFLRIAQRHALQPVPVYFTGHEAGLFLARAGMFSGTLRALIEDRFDRAEFVRHVRGARWHSGIVWLGAARALLRRGELERAAAAVFRAREAALPVPNPHALDIVQAEILRRTGQDAEAQTLLAPHLRDPAIGGLVRWYLDAADLALLDFL